MEISSESRLEIKKAICQQNLFPPLAAQPNAFFPVSANPFSSSRVIEETSPKLQVEAVNLGAAPNESKSEYKSIVQEIGRWNKEEDNLFIEGIIGLMYRTLNVWKKLVRDPEASQNKK